MICLVVASVLLLKAEAGSRPGGRGTCSLLRQRKVPKRKATPLPVSPSPDGRGGSLRCSVLGCTAELAAFPLRVNSAQTTAVSQFTMRVSFGTRSPQALRFSARSEGGGSGLHTGHCFARPGVPSLHSARRAAAPPIGSAQRVTDTRRGCAAAAGWTPLPTPAGCAEKRRAWGGCVCRRTHALRDLACRCCLSGVQPQGERSEFIGTTPGPSIAGCPHRPPGDGGRRLGVAFSLVTFSWRRKRKLLRRRAHTPASALNQSTQQPQHKRQANGL